MPKMDALWVANFENKFMKYCFYFDPKLTENELNRNPICPYLFKSSSIVNLAHLNKNRFSSEFSQDNISSQSYCPCPKSG